MMHGIIANMVVHAGRTLIGELSGPQGSQTPATEGTKTFSSIMQSQSVREATSIQDILAAKPNISESELIQVSQELKMQIVQGQMGQHGERAPLSLGEWTIQKSIDSTGNATIQISDLSGKSMQFDQFSSTYKQANLLQQIQEHLDQSSSRIPVL